MKNDILTLLQTDPGQRTFGQLLQEREAAVHEIKRLRANTEAIGPALIRPRPTKDNADDSSEHSQTPLTFRPGSLIRAGDICELLSISRATLHRLRLLKHFPKFVRLGPNTIRWRYDEIIAWQYDQSKK